MTKPFVVIGGGLWQRGSRGWRWAKRNLVPRKPKPVPPPPKLNPVTMYDSVTVAAIPNNAEAVAGYVGGHWPTFATLVRLFPKAHKLSIAVNSSEDAMCLDVEKGDASPAQAPAWVKRQQARGIKKPVVYTSVSLAQGLLNVLAANGVKRADVRLWTAHYTGHAHRCSNACGFGLKTTADATQYDDKALGRNLDVSLCSPTFFAK